MPEQTEDGRPTHDGGSPAAADTGYSEWISEVRRLYVEPKGPAELHVVEDEPGVAAQPARGRGRRLGRGRRNQPSPAPVEPPVDLAAPPRPTLADLMAGGAASTPADAGAEDTQDRQPVEAYEPEAELVVEPEPEPSVEPVIVDEPEPGAVEEPEAPEPEPEPEPEPVAVEEPEPADASEPAHAEAEAEQQRRPGRRVEWPSLEGDESRPAFEPWAVVARREPASAEGEPVATTGGGGGATPVDAADDEDWPVAVAAQDEGWPVAAPTADLAPDAPSDPSPEQAWVAALADAHDAALASSPGAVASDGSEGSEDEDSAPPTHSWWDEGPLDGSSALPADDETPERPPSTPTAAPEPSAVDADAPRSSWFDETPEDELADRSDPVHAPSPNPGRSTPDPAAAGAGALPPWPTRAPGDPLTRREDPSEAPTTRAQTRAAARQAARQRAARRRRALVAAVVLLVVVAAGWWVLRPHGTAAAGASVRPGTAATAPAVADAHPGVLRS